MITLSKTEQFLAFCIECYRQKYNLSGQKVIELFENKKVFDFLEQGYEALHTQGKYLIINEIEQFIDKKVILKLIYIIVVSSILKRLYYKIL